MRSTGTRIAIALLCTGALLAGCASKQGAEQPAEAAPAAAAAPSVPVVEVTASSLNVRATPSGTGSLLGSLKQGARASAPQPEANGWIYVETDTGLKGYVASKFVRAVEGAAAAPAAAPAAQPAPAAESAPAPKGRTARPPTPGTPLARVQVGMTEAQVIEILGQPTSQQNYMTGKAWIPWYYGSDTSRLDYRYKGVGLVAFSRNRYSGGTKVVRVDEDPNEDGLP
jgi:hypothetical protein